MAQTSNEKVDEYIGLIKNIVKDIAILTGMSVVILGVTASIIFGVCYGIFIALN